MNGGLCVHKYFNFVEVSMVKTSMLPNNGTSVGQESKVETYRLVAAVICYVWLCTAYIVSAVAAVAATSIISY